MPLYEYECGACGERFEVIQKFSDPPAEACKVCGKGPVRRLMSSPAIQFKGSGWYITDYARKGASDKTSTGDAKKGGADSGTTSETSAKGEGAAKSETPTKTETSSSTPTPAKDKAS